MLVKKIINEPLVHFFALAISIFVCFNVVNNDQQNPFQIHISEGRIKLIENSFIERWKRSPLPKELDTAIHNTVLHEAYVREARALGFDQSDKIIDRRLRQKMDFMLNDLANVSEPDDATLMRFYNENLDKYMQAERYSFEQVYFPHRQQTAEQQQWIDTQQQRIKQGLPPIAHTSLLPRIVQDQREELLLRRFGRYFVQQLKTLQIKTWQGPIDSDIGKHFVYLSAQPERTAFSYEEVKDKVLNDWHYNNVLLFQKGFEEKLLSKYSIQIDRQVAAPANTNDAQGN